jgi:signal transduction histidine kinase
MLLKRLSANLQPVNLQISFCVFPDSTDACNTMQVVLPELIGAQVSLIDPTLDDNLPPKSIVENSKLREFCHLQIEQLIHHIPDVWVRLVYCCPERLQRQILIQGVEFWSRLDTNLQDYLQSETWYLSQNDPRLREILEEIQQRFYVYPLSQKTREYLLIGTCRPLSAKQKQFVEVCAQSLKHYISTIQEFSHYRNVKSQIEQRNHQIEHQLRNPIALIEIYTKILLSVIKEEQPRSQLEFIQLSIEEISRHLKQLNESEDLLHIAPCDLRKILADSLHNLQPWLHEKQITIEHPNTPAFLEADAWQLKQVFENLISNAIHFSPCGGTIGCTWHVFQHDILIEVWDEGPGVSETDLQHVFTAFYSRRPGGTGLGLSIAEQIITTHQGHLWVSNLPGKGAKFSCRLPIHQSHSDCPKFVSKDRL